MFTGIIQAVGKISTVAPLGGADAGVRLQVDTGSLDCSDIVLGDSVAVSGACLTVVDKSPASLAFDVSAESLRCTAGLAQTGAVNLEKALRFGDRLGGHLVSGHVDGVGTVRQFHPAGESYVLEVEAQAALARYIAVKGSITVDGVSLTVNRVQGSRFAVNLIPHTVAVTTLGGLRVGQLVNLEVDMLARYLERLVEGRELTVIAAGRPL
ncbi:MAG: riboflavin synthase [Betaproteobacteria bacterium]